MFKYELSNSAHSNEDGKSEWLMVNQNFLLKLANKMSVNTYRFAVNLVNTKSFSSMFAKMYDDVVGFLFELNSFWECTTELEESCMSL